MFGYAPMGDVGMKAVVQRVSSASVAVEEQEVAKIGPGLLVLLGMGKGDTVKDIQWMVDKVINLRIFEKDNGKFDRSLLDINGELLVVSQFTLYGDCSKGRRPSFTDAMETAEARQLFELFVKMAKEKTARVESGVFQASMKVFLVNDGPVTLIVDSRL